MALLVLRRDGLCVGQNRMCLLKVGIEFTHVTFIFNGVREYFVFQNILSGGKKIKHRSVGNECRLTRCLFVISFLVLCLPVKMVYFSQFLVACLMLSCRPLRLLATC